MTHLEHLLGGLLGGFASTLVCHPLDLLKTRFAANEGIGSAGKVIRPQYASYVQAIRQITAVDRGGIRSLYQGLTPNLVGATVAWGLYLQFYQMIKGAMRQSMNVDSLASYHNLSAGVLSGAAVILITNPIWVIKTRMCLQYESQKRVYTSMSNTFVSICRHEGIGGLYKGLTPGLLGTMHGALQIMAYDQLKDWKFRRLGVADTSKLRTIDYLAYSCISKVFAVTCTYPYQVVRIRLQDHHASYRGVLDVIVRTYRGEGIAGFYKGLLAGNIRVLPAVAITFIVYENVTHLFRP